MLQPKTGGAAEWDYFFLSNPGKTAAAALALEKLDASSIIKAQGELHYLSVVGELKMELIAGKRQGWDKELIIQNYGEKYLKNLKRFLKQNNLSVASAQEIAA